MNSLSGLVDVVGPHILFQLGPVVYAMPVLGWDLQSLASLIMTSKDFKAP